MNKIGFLLSGSGSTLKNFLEWQKQGKLKGEIAVVVSSKPGVKGLEIAREAGIPAFCVEYKSFAGNIKAYSQAITQKLKEYGAQWVVMGGFLSLYEVPACYENRVFNVHPSLIPAFCGQGMYGHRVHEAVIQYGAKVTGCTVHVVNARYDNGPIAAQAVVEVEESDTPETLAARVQQKEREIYPAVVNDFLEGRLIVSGRRVVRG